MDPDLDYIAHLARDSARFAEAIRGAAPDAPVPTCPDWNADDLLWHLGEVQWFWGTIVRENVARARAEELKPQRPAGRAALLEFYDRTSRDLAATLAAHAPESPAWTWSDDKTVGFVRRRQAHEALIHRLDAELTAGPGHRTPMDPVLSCDGVDEALRVMFGSGPEWGRFTPDDPAATVRLRATDTGGSWLVTLGQFTGTDPDRKSYDQRDFDTADHDAGTEAAAEIRGRAADLDCWLWGRPPLTPLERSGDPQALSDVNAAID